MSRIIKKCCLLKRQRGRKRKKGREEEKSQHVDGKRSIELSRDGPNEESLHLSMLGSTLSTRQCIVKGRGKTEKCPVGITHPCLFPK